MIQPRLYPAMLAGNVPPLSHGAAYLAPSSRRPPEVSLSQTALESAKTHAAAYVPSGIFLNNYVLPCLSTEQQILNTSTR